MKRIWYLVLFLLVSFSACNIQDDPKGGGVPELKGRVNDYADLLDESTRENLEKILKAHEDSTTNQIVVLTVESIGDVAIEEYSMKVAEAWKIGQKEKNNGVLIIIAKEEKKVRIEVGYGLEGVLPDAQCGYIIDHIFLPSVKQKNPDFDEATTNTVLALIRTVHGEYNAIVQETTEKETSNAFLIVLGIVCVISGIIGLIADNPFVSAGISAVVFPLVYIYFYVFSVIAVLMIVAGFVAGFVSRYGIELAIEMKSGGGSGGGFSGGGGSFGGGGASGGW